MTSLNIVILAAGQGTRMRSDRPKILHTVGGKPLLQHVYERAGELNPETTVIVYGHGGEQVRQRFPDWSAHWVEQSPQLGTGHAVQQALPILRDDALILVLYGDVPLLQRPPLERLLSVAATDTLALLTVDMNDPTGYGRIVRDAEGRVVRIVEEKDAAAEEKKITEVNTGILAVPGFKLKTWLDRLDNDNAQGEYYLTDVIAMAATEGMMIETVSAPPDDVAGVNNKRQLAALERIYQSRQAEDLLDRGVTLRDPARFDLRGDLEAVGRDVEIDVNVVLEGTVRLGHRVKIGPQVVIRDAVIGDDVEIMSHSVIEQAEIGARSRVGPFARIRPQTVLAEEAHVGNFVEIKKSTLGGGTKVNHLSYIGDSEVGAGVNVGAGTITCNYDGANKHKTVIEDGAFIGSDTQLVAPVKVGRDATIGAGSTITRDAPAEKLTLSRSKQFTIEHWQRPTKQR
ncbi:MAG: bifunctional UDP-N-acetylglucosamine diphosphorylase/glucosamine-1-phosphate N-acetyltransferase GlmU [Methylohalobius crimeensis]